METVLSKASTLSSEEFSRFSTTLGGPEHIRTLLEMTETCASVRSNASLVHHLTTVLAALTYGSRDKMAVLIDHFRPYPLDFNRFDLEHNPDIEQKVSNRQCKVYRCRVYCTSQYCHLDSKANSMRMYNELIL